MAAKVQWVDLVGHTGGIDSHQHRWRRRWLGQPEGGVLLGRVSLQANVAGGRAIAGSAAALQSAVQSHVSVLEVFGHGAEAVGAGIRQAGHDVKGGIISIGAADNTQAARLFAGDGSNIVIWEVDGLEGDGAWEDVKENGEAIVFSADKKIVYLAQGSTRVDDGILIPDWPLRAATTLK